MKVQPRASELNTKVLVRERVWGDMERLGVARFPTPCRGRIPNFEGSKDVAERLGTLEAYRRSEAVFVGPDVALKACRDRVLRDGKTLAFATPGMREFKELRPEMKKRDTSIRGLKRYGDSLATAVSVIILGSVAVDLKGNRIGKGAGYGDREVAWLAEHRLSVDGAVRMTPVHPIQVFDDLEPLMEPTDEPVDFVIVPGEAIPVRFLAE